VGKPNTDQTPEDSLYALICRADKGDETTLPALREALKDPRLVDAVGGDLGSDARWNLVRKISGKSVLQHEVLLRKLDNLKAELSGPAPAPLEALLVDRVLTCWLYLHYLENDYTNRVNVSPCWGDYFQRCINAAQKRYLAAIKTLATVRKLALPVLQVNIARKQVNVAATAVGNVGQLE
jgi:hypothetical protein